MADRSFKFLDGSGFTNEGTPYVAPGRGLPGINQENGQATYSVPAVGDSIGQFNVNLMSLLQKAQNANSGNTALTAQRGKLEVGQTADSMARAADLGIEGLAPGDAMRARINESELYNPEIRSLNDRMQLNNEAVQRFESTIKAAKEYGEEVSKYIKPSEETIEAVRMQLRAGEKPSDDVLAKVGQYLSEDDWNAWTAAKNESPMHKEWRDYKREGGKLDFNAYMNMDANRKRSVTNISTGSTGFTNDEKRSANRARLNSPDATQYFLSTKPEFQDLWIRNVTPLEGQSFTLQEVSTNYNSWENAQKKSGYGS